MASENFYEGTSSGLYPDKDISYSGRVLAGKIGGTTSIQTANQLQEVSNLLNSGMKAVELQPIQEGVLEMIPKEHLKEINRLSQLTKSELSLHAPMIEPSGFTQQGWSEQNREDAERQFTNIVLRAHELSPNKPLPITIHSSAVPGTETMPKELIKGGLTDEEKAMYKNGQIPVQMVVVNQNTGEMTGVRREIKHYPGEPEGKMYSPEKELEIKNRSYWDHQLSQLLFYKERGDELLNKNYGQVMEEFSKLRNLDKISPQDVKNVVDSMTPTQKEAYSNVKNAEIYLENTQQTLSALFNEAYKASNEKGKEALATASQMFKEDLEEGQKHGFDPRKYSRALQGILESMQQITINSKGGKLTPEIYVPIEKFATEKASETFSNVAVEAYKKFGKDAPFISIENPPYGTAISTAEDLKKLIEESRNKFAEKIKREKGLSDSEAKKAAEQMIGATWDTSHISMIRKQGYGKEELIKQAETIAPFVKHVHYNDNFGFTHTDLPPGMGDVPLKEIIEKLNK